MRDLFGMAWPLGLKAVMLHSIFVVAFGDWIIASFAHTPWVAQLASAYLHVFLWGVAFEAVAQVFSSHFNGCGNTRISFYSYLIALPVNIGLSLVLIHGLYGVPEWGVVGAAAGSAVAAALRTLFLIWLFWRIDGHLLAAKGWSKATFLHALQRHWVFLLPIAGTFVSMSIGTQVCALMYATITVNEFAAMTLINPWIQTAGTVGMAWPQATGIAVAQLLGRSASEASLDAFLSRAWRWAFVAAGIVSFCYATLCLMAGRLYDDLTLETTALMLTFLPIPVLLPFPKGSNAMCGQTLRGAGDTKYFHHRAVVLQGACHGAIGAVL